MSKSNAATQTKQADLFIVDNSDRQRNVQRYLHEWCAHAQAIDIATGHFEIGGLLALDNAWQAVDQIRILMGDEVSLRTARAFQGALENIAAVLDRSLEAEKEKNDFLEGVPAIVEALRAEAIDCRVYRRQKFHAKSFITHHRQDIIGSFALVGSSNLSRPGLTENVELNVRLQGTQVEALQEWYEQHWKAAEDITPEILRVIERHTRDYSPFEVYAKSLHAFLAGEELSDTAWENNDSVMFPKLAQYQKDAYGALLKKSENYGGALLCDGVGLGKTYVGLALIERLAERDRQRVALFVPKAARESVWEQNLKQFLPDLYYGGEGFKIFNHTDLLREGEIAEQLDYVRRRYDVVLIDEAHHFRNTGTKGDDPEDPQSHYWAMHRLCENKRLLMLTATPVNNRLVDLQHMIELFARDTTNYFSRLGIHSLKGHFRTLERQLREQTSAPNSNASIDDDTADELTVDTNVAEADQILTDSPLFQALVVQRSRGYVKENLQITEGAQTVFPERQPPKVAAYSLKKVYGRLLDQVEQAFHKTQPLFSLPIYYPWEYYRHDKSKIDTWTTGRQKQIVQLIRTGFLKGLESSAAAFEASCWNLLKKVLAWIEVHSETQPEKDRLEKWKTLHGKLLDYEQHKQGSLFDAAALDEQDEDVIPAEMLEAVEKLDREDFDISGILDDSYQDLRQIRELLEEVRKVKPRNDSKLQELIKLLKTDPVLSQHKVVIFTEFMTTARYLEQQLKEAGIDGVDEVDSNRASTNKRGDIIRRFAPYYNGSSSAELEAQGQTETRILISTDVLSEGLNLQDATRIINYDLHWNPVRLMQRIGRVDRRLNPEFEARIKADHPDRAAIRGNIAYYNFLPPEELNHLLSLYQTVTHKVLRISETLGIEGGQLLTPEDEHKHLRIFDEKYEGHKSPLEKMRNKLARLLRDDPTLEERLDALPGRVFSGRKYPSGGGTGVPPVSADSGTGVPPVNADTRAVFFCYALPAYDQIQSEKHNQDIWTLDAGRVQWYLYDLTSNGGTGVSPVTEDSSPEILEDPAAIDTFIRCKPDQPRSCTFKQADLATARKAIEKHIKNTWLKSIQAPLDDPKPKLIAWMELN